MIRLLPKRDLSREIWKLAGPVVIGMISLTLLNVVDAAMVGRLGATALAATGLGGMLTWMVLGTLNTLNIGTQAVTARRYGEGNLIEAGRVLDNSLTIALIVGVIGTVFFAPLMRWLYQFFSADPDVTVLGRDYVYYRVLGSLPQLIIASHRGFFDGVSQTQSHMRVMIVVNLLNILFNYALIFGHFGMPAMGAPGAGLASALATVAGAALFLVQASVHPMRRQLHYWKRSNLDFRIVRSILRLAGPTAVRAVLIMLGFSTFYAIVARIGTVEVAATNVILVILSLSYLPGAGIGIATATMIGQKLGEQQPDQAEVYGWEAVRLGVMTMGSIGLIFILFPDPILRIFTSDLTVVEAGKLPLRLLGFVQIFDAAGMVLSAALEGAGMNRWVLFAELAVNWGIFIPLTLIVTRLFGVGILGAWSALGFYLVFFGTIVTLKFRKGEWKTVKV